MQSSNLALTGVILLSGILSVILAPAVRAQCEFVKLTASDAEDLDDFGFSVAVEDDVMVIGAHTGSHLGSAYIYRYDGTQWIEEAILAALDGALGDQFGRSVAISGDVVVIGAPFDDDQVSQSGSAYVFRFDPDASAWIEETKLTASNAAREDWFGLNVAVSGDVIVVGAINDDDACPQDPDCNSGSAYVYRFDPDMSAWTEEAKLTASDAAAGDVFGRSVSIDHDVVVIGAPFDDDRGIFSGSAYVFRFDPDEAQWGQETKLIPNDNAAYDRFGDAVFISNEVCAIGAPFNNGRGSTYVYRFDSDNSSWIEEANLTASDAEVFDQYGSSVSISEDTILVGAWRSDDAGSSSGSAYVYRFDSDTAPWMEESKLTASDAAEGDIFGIGVSVSGGRAVIGAAFDDDDGLNSGSAYVYSLGVGTGDTDGDGQVDFNRVFTLLTEAGYTGWAALEWECCVKSPEQGAAEGAPFIAGHIIE
ncbi:MAG: hypothetical protein IID39_04040, partial [Planctomycetes bacterium]|nr:hypothetical protein [Planctomycetota bacterium]